MELVLRDFWALLDFGWRYTATGSSDSHRIQYHWAGYPRTMVTIDPDATRDADLASVDPMTVVAKTSARDTRPSRAGPCSSSSSGRRGRATSS